MRAGKSISTLVAAAAATLALTAAVACSDSEKRTATTGGASASRLQLDDTPPYHGIDISSHQAMIDWKSVAGDNNINFVYIKATEGATYSSPHYGYNVEMARRRGILVGSYHYFTTTASVRSQYENFIHLAAASTQDLIPMIDIEDAGDWTRRQLCDSLTTFASMLERHYGRRPMIYSMMTFYNAYLAPHFNSYPLYIGRYSTQPPAIDWNGRYTIWQYSQNGVVPGIDRYVDLCLFAPGRSLRDITL